MRFLVTSRKSCSWICIAAFLVLPCFGQGTIEYQRFYTPNPDPDFPYDFQGARVWSLGVATLDVDMNSDGSPEFMFQSDRSAFRLFITPGNRVSGVKSLNTVFLLNLETGTRIGPGSDFWETDPTDAVIASCRDIGCIGAYPGVESGYAGLEFELDGETHYGWVRLGVPGYGINGGWVFDMAWETRPDTAILVGAVPEPSSLALFIAAGVILVLRFIFTRRNFRAR